MALHFLSGPAKGKEFLLPSDRDIVVGFSEANEWLIDDPRINRPVATIATKTSSITIKDLASEKGTFVNGQPIREASVTEGDRVRISGVTCMLVSLNRFSTTFRKREKRIEAEAAAPAPPPPTPKNLKVTPGKISGSIKEIPVVEILQFLCNSRKSGVLRINHEEKTGRIYLRDGHVFYATINGLAPVHPQKMLFRLLRWRDGNFELEAPSDDVFPEEIRDPTSHILLDGVQQSDEIHEFGPDVPPEPARLRLANPLPGTLRTCAPQELDVIQLILENPTVQYVLDNYPVKHSMSLASDLETYTHLVALIRRKFVVVEA